MSSALRSALGGMNRGILHCASRLVPREQRADWLREWNAELWHMRRSCPPVDGFGWKSEGVAAAFCLGAFQDAFCVRHLCRQGSAGGLFATWLRPRVSALSWRSPGRELHPCLAFLPVSPWRASSQLSAQARAGFCCKANSSPTVPRQPSMGNSFST